MGTLPRAGSVHADVAATPSQIWAVLTDISRAGEWSHETRGGQWLGGASAAVPGARFRGHNGKKLARWSRACVIEQAVAPSKLVWSTVPSRLYRDSTRWTVELTPVDGGTRITQSFEILRLGPVLDRLFYATIPAHRDRSEALEGDLRSLGEVAARETAVAPA